MTNSRMTTLDNSKVLAKFVREVSALAQSSGIVHVVIVARDPSSNEEHVIASPGAMEALRNTIATKFGFADGSEAEWT